MAQMQQRVDIARTLEEVFAFVANSANDALWGSNLVEVTKVSTGPVGWAPGSATRPASLAGSSSWCVRSPSTSPTAATQSRPSPAPCGSAAWTFEAIPGGTRLTLTGSGRSGGFFGLAEPLLARAAQRSLRTDLATLTRLLEDQTQA
jgi:hypothetical protein